MDTGTLPGGGEGKPQGEQEFGLRRHCQRSPSDFKKTRRNLQVELGKARADPRRNRGAGNAGLSCLPHVRCSLRMIERMRPGTLKLELFGRKHNIRNNWITLGAFFPLRGLSS